MCTMFELGLLELKRAGFAAPPLLVLRLASPIPPYLPCWFRFLYTAPAASCLLSKKPWPCPLLGGIATSKPKRSKRVSAGKQATKLSLPGGEALLGYLIDASIVTPAAQGRLVEPVVWSGMGNLDYQGWCFIYLFTLFFCYLPFVPCFVLLLFDNNYERGGHCMLATGSIFCFAFASLLGAVVASLATYVVVRTWPSPEYRDIKGTPGITG